MRKVMVTEHVTLEGVMEAPGGEASLGARSGWSFLFWNMVFPLVLGIGKRLFRYGSSATLILIQSRALTSGVVVLDYQPSR